MKDRPFCYIQLINRGVALGTFAVYFRHYRSRSDLSKFGLSGAETKADIKTAKRLGQEHRAQTYCELRDEHAKIAGYSVALCSWKDNFSRVIGRKESLKYALFNLFNEKCDIIPSVKLLEAFAYCVTQKGTGGDPEEVWEGNFCDADTV